MSDAVPTASWPIAAKAESLPATLPAVIDGLWRRISDGCDGRWTSWGLPTLASIGIDGTPRVRVLALRSVQPERRTFEFHADARSDKTRELVADSRVSLLFWDPADAVEARFAGTAVVHHGDAEARAAWRTASSLRRSASAVQLAPGARLDGPARFDALPAGLDEDAAFVHFVLIRVEATALDWLWLGPRDLRRARFRWTGADWSGSWVVP